MPDVRRAVAILFVRVHNNLIFFIFLFRWWWCLVVQGVLGVQKVDEREEERFVVRRVEETFCEVAERCALR